MEVELCSLAGGHFIQDANPDGIDVAALTWDFLVLQRLPEPSPSALSLTACAVLAALLRLRGRCCGPSRESDTA